MKVDINMCGEIIIKIDLKKINDFLFYFYNNLDIYTV